MEPKKVFTMLLLFFLSFFLYVYFVRRSKNYSGRLPPGSFGLPLVGQTFNFLKALKADKLEIWFHIGIAEYGPVWKTSLFGTPTVVLHGTTANKFIYTSNENILSNTQPPPMIRIFGTNNILELTGDDHKRVRGALVSFLKPDVLKQYVAKVDDEIQNHLETHWCGKNEVQVQPLIRILTFNVICSLLFGIEQGPKREKLRPLFRDMIKSMLAFPVNLPFTQFGCGIKARKKLVPLLVDLLQEKRDELNKQTKKANPHKDLITSLLDMRNNDNSSMMSDEEIIDNIIFMMIAGHDTTSILLTLLMRVLANNESIYSKVTQEHEEVSRSKAPGEALTWEPLMRVASKFLADLGYGPAWEDLTKMTYTWRVASETLRINPPVNISFRHAANDIEYGGYIIPKGWQVIWSSSMTHMSNSIFQNPTMFDPTRFEKHTPPPPSFSLVPFGAGSRMCPGIELAKMETLVMLHRLVTNFKWELLNKDESFKRIPVLEFDQGLLVRISPIKEVDI